jgi:hypothetical protein
MAIEITASIITYSLEDLTPNSIVNQCVILCQNLYTNSSHAQVGTIFTNNIWYNTNFNPANFPNCVFTNNITYNITSAAISMPSANNQIQVNPLFVGTNIPTAAYGYNNGFSNAGGYNYRLQTSSPGHNAATDGTDLGIYGGGYPMNATGVVPAIPQVSQMIINNAAVPQNGTLNVTFKARKQN